MNEQPYTLHERDAARFLGFSPDYLRQARMKNEGPAFVRVRRSIRYRVEDLRAWLAAHRVETGAGDASRTAPADEHAA